MKSTPTIVTGWALLGIAALFTMLRRESPSSPEAAAAPPSRASGRSSRVQVVTPPADVVRQLEAGDDPGLQSAVSDWFTRDPISVRKWLDAKASVVRLQPVLAQLAKDIAASGQPAEALKWAERLQSGPDRDQTLFEIYATGRRYRSLSDEEIRGAPFPPKKIDDLLSGAADD